MIQVHIVELFATDEIAKSSIGKFLMFLGGPPVAPVFTLIFGYFIAASTKTIGELVLRGLKIVALGMLLNIALNFNLILSVNKGLLQIDVWPYVFGVDILQFAGIALIVIAILKKLIDRSIIFTITLIIVTATSGQFFLSYVPDNVTLKYLTAFFYGSTHWSYFPVFPWIAYPLSGIALYKLQQHYGYSLIHFRKNKTLYGGAFLLFLAVTINYAITVASDLPSYYHHGIVFFTWTIVFLVFYGLFMHEVCCLSGEPAIMRYLKWLGENVTIIYVFQWIIIGNIATEIFKTVALPFYLVLSFISVLAASSGFTYFIIKIKRG